MSYSNILGPGKHSHEISDVNNLQTTLNSMSSPVVKISTITLSSNIDNVSIPINNTSDYSILKLIGTGSIDADTYFSRYSMYINNITSNTYYYKEYNSNTNYSESSYFGYMVPTSNANGAIIRFMIDLTITESGFCVMKLYSAEKSGHYYGYNSTISSIHDITNISFKSNYDNHYLYFLSGSTFTLYG